MYKKFLPFVVLATSLVSCSKSDDNSNALANFQITKADVINFYKPNGNRVSSYSIDSSAVVIPMAGDNQNWDFTAHIEKDTFSNGGSSFKIPTNTGFSDATYFYTNSNNRTVAGVNSNQIDISSYFITNDNGLFYSGYSQDQIALISVPAYGATFDFPVQNVKLSTPIPSILFPAKYKDSSTSVAKDSFNYIVNAPAFQLNNVPAYTRTITTSKNEIIARGNVKLKNIGSKKALVVKSTKSYQTNYFLGGQPLPAQLASLLGIVDGATETEVLYTYYAEGTGIVATIDINTKGLKSKNSFRK